MGIDTFWRRTSGAAVPFGLALCLAACGSTVQVSSTRQTGAGDGISGTTGAVSTDGSTSAGSGDTGTGSVPTSAGSGGSSGGSGTPVSGSSTGSGSATSGTSGTSTGASGTGGSTSSGGKSTSSGGTISIGVQYFDSTSVNAFVNSTGSDKRVGDPRKQAQAVIDYLNARGGLAGHKIVPVFVKNDLTGSNSYAQDQTNGCATWTQDHRVAAGFWFAGTISTPTIQECARKNHFLLTHGGLYMSQKSEYTSNPYFVAQAQLSGERFAPAVVNGLAAQGFYSAKAKIGLLTFDDAASKAAARALDKSLATRGLKVTDTQYFPAVQQTSDTGAFVSQLQSAVLKFRGDGITHVMSILAGGGGIPTFMQAAESQKYFPRYGLSSIDGLNGIPTGSSDRKHTLTNTVAVGWSPSTDVAVRQDPGQNSTATACRKILGKTLLSRTDELLALPYCDFFLMLAAATQPLAVGAPLDADALVRSVSALKGSWRSATTLGTYLAADRRDGVAAVRNLTYAADCDCFQYSPSQTRL